MNIQIEPVMPEQKDIFAQLMNLYDYDFTEYTNADIKESGYYYENVDGFLLNDKLRCYFIRVDGILAGFVIIGDGGYMYLEDESAHNIDEFFVMRKYRRSGVGRFAAESAFNMHKGKWEVCQMPNNTPARKFWKTVIAGYTRNNYQEVGTENDNMVGFIFDNSKL